MKTFIVLFLLIIGFFSFLFFNNPPNGKTKKQIVKLEDIEKIENNNNDNSKEIITDTSLSDEAPTAIPEDQTFETIKNILKKATNQKYTSNITLNTDINSYLYTRESKDKFKNEICSAFNLSSEEFDKSFKKNKIVWDWVNQLRE
jgi:ABC-type transport system involved in multi-copper enzyme maturation permease subunit